MQLTKLDFLLCVLLLSLVLAACGTDDDETKSPLPANIVNEPTLSFQSTIGDALIQGQNLYNQHCAVCHGVDGEGQSPENPFGTDNGLDPAPPHDETGHTWHHADDLLIEIIHEGGITNAMPAFGEKMDTDQIEMVLDYIKTFWTDEQRGYQREVTEALRSK